MQEQSSGLCACGCGRPINPGRRFVLGHSRRGRHSNNRVVRSLAERFWPKVDQTNGPHACWPWIGYRDPKGYGQVWTGSGYDGAHRVALALTGGPLGPGECALHWCDNPPCCNPAHLFRGEPILNTADMLIKGRHRYARHLGERNGFAKLTADAVRDIRRLSAEGESDASLARRFSVTDRAIHRVVKRRNWAHVD
jgi:hypothetical protein